MELLGCCGVGQACNALYCSVYRKVRCGLTWARTRSLGVMLLGKAARLSMSLRLLEWKFSLCCFSSLRVVVVQEASLCRRIFTESDSRLKSQTVSRVDARKTPINSKPLRRCWFGQRVEGGGKDAVTTLAV